MELKELINSKKYFLFDFDGTLADLEELNYTTFQKVIEKIFNRPFPYDQYFKYFSGAGSKKGFNRYFEGENIVTELDLDELVEKYREIKRIQLQENFENVVKIKDGAKEFLKYLKDNGKKLAIGSSSAKEFITYILKKAELYEYFDEIVTVEDVKESKPSPEIFLTAMERVGGIIAETLIFEDSQTGVDSAKNANIDFVVIHTKGRNDKTVVGERYVIEDYIKIFTV